MSIFEDPTAVASFNDLQTIAFEIAKKELIEEFANKKEMDVDKFKESLKPKEIAELEERATVRAADVASRIRNLAERVSLYFLYNAVERKLHERFDEAGSVEAWLKERIDSDVSQVATSAAFLFEMVSTMNMHEPGFSDTLFANELSFRKLIKLIPKMRGSRDNLFMLQHHFKTKTESAENDIKVLKDIKWSAKTPEEKDKAEKQIQKITAELKEAKQVAAKEIKEADIVLQETIKATFNVAMSKNVNREEAPIVVQDILQKSLEERGVKPKYVEKAKPPAYYYTDGKESLIVITANKSFASHVLGVLAKLLDTHMSDPEEMIRVVKQKIKK